MNKLFWNSTIWIALAGIAMYLGACKKPAGGPAQTQTTPAATSQNDSLAAAVPSLKIGYLNSMELLSIMPEIQAADKQVEAFAKGKERTFNSLATQYQTKLQDLQQNGPAMLQAQQEAAVKELQGLEERLQAMQANTQGEVAREKERLYEPILSRADSVIKLIGKEEGYTVIYDAPGLLYVDTTLNMLPKVKARLGLPDQPAAPAGQQPK